MEKRQVAGERRESLILLPSPSPTNLNRETWFSPARSNGDDDDLIAAGLKNALISGLLRSMHATQKPTCCRDNGRGSHLIQDLCQSEGTGTYRKPLRSSCKCGEIRDDDCHYRETNGSSQPDLATTTTVFTSNNEIAIRTLPFPCQNGIDFRHSNDSMLIPQQKRSGRPLPAIFFRCLCLCLARASDSHPITPRGRFVCGDPSSRNAAGKARK